MMLRELFSQKPNIIINTDIDGFLSGMILQTYLGCKIVGFSNSKSEVWVSPEISNIYAPVYIDLFVNRPDVHCVEQHIIAIDDEHSDRLKRCGTKFNPNLEITPNRTFFGDYYHKYPFATVHYIIAKLAAEGIDVQFPNLDNIIIAPNKSLKIELGHIILRADDAMFTSLSAYKDNADLWWQWLTEISSHSRAISILKDFINHQDANLASDKKREIGEFFRKGLLCDGADGAFNEITDTNGYLQDRIKNYAMFLSETFQWGINLPDEYILHHGRFLKKFASPKTVGELRSMIANPSMYSYAFIYGPYSRYQNFSYTLDMA